jgi:hypothetical protein
LAWRRSGGAVLHAIGDFAPLLVRQVRGCAVQRLVLGRAYGETAPASVFSDTFYADYN